MGAINTTIWINEVRETAVVSTPTTVYTLYGSDTKDSGDGSFSDPSVFVNGVVQLPAAYTIDKVDGEITFLVAPSGTVTCTYTWEYAAVDSEDTSVYTFEEPPNIKSIVDVNGYRQIVETKNIAQPWAGVIAWEYIDTDFYNAIRHIFTTAGTTLSIKLDSLPADNPVKTLTRLKIMTGPKWTGIPGVPCKTNVSINCMQLES